MTTIEVLSDSTIKVSVIDIPAIEIQIDQPSPIEVDVLVGGIVQQIISPSPEYEIAVGVIENDPTVYKEFSYTDGDLTQISTWDSPSKNTLLMQKTFAYSTGDLSSITTTYSGISMRTSFTFSNGDLVSVNTIRL